MRFVNRLHLLILLSLALCVFCGELGESVRLADDVSNDLVEVSPESASISKAPEIAAWDVIPEREMTLYQDSLRSLFAVPFTPIAVSSTQDLLRLLSIQRK